MKQILLFIGLFIASHVAFAQTLNIDSVYQTFAAEKDESQRLKLLNSFFGDPVTADPVVDIQYAQKILELALKHKDMISEALALSQIGYNYMYFGNTVKGLEYKLKSIEAAERSGNYEMLADSELHLGLYFYREKEYERVIKLGRKGNETAFKAKNEIMNTWADWLVGAAYCELNQLDSALMYTQRSYDVSLRIKYFNEIDWIYASLGKIQGKLGNDKLAIAYYEMAIKEGLKEKIVPELSKYYTELGQLYFTLNKKDSSAVYAKKAIELAQNTEYFKSNLEPAKLLLDIYRGVNSDSAFKYSEINRIANDSLFSATKIKQTNLMTLTEDLRQQELEDAKLKAEEERHHNIQLALLAIGIVTFIILFLLLSRSFITNTKLIEFFGVIALLLVFEFLNLLLHPAIGSITHHSPVLMLIAMVILAAFLVPLHHKVEKWTTKILVEKNKAIRLAKAKKTISELEGNAPVLDERGLDM